MIETPRMPPLRPPVPAWGLPCGRLTWILLHQKPAFGFSELPEQRAGTPGTNPQRVGRRRRDVAGAPPSPLMGSGTGEQRCGAEGVPGDGTGDSAAERSWSNSAPGSPRAPLPPSPGSLLPPPTGLWRAGKKTPGRLEIPGTHNAMMFSSFSSPPQDPPGVGGTFLGRRNDNVPPLYKCKSI